MATRSDKNKLLVNGYIRELYSPNIVPKEINDLIFLFYFMVIGSDMLTKKEEEQLMEWIDDSNKCDFKLLYKATQHGFGSEEFHKKCDEKGANISIIRSDNECIFGGYTSKSWISKNNWISDKSAWLYSLKNEKGNQRKFKIGKDEEHYAVYGDNDCGPCYGNGDLFTTNNCNENEDSWTELGRCYEGRSNPFQLNDGTMYFKVLDYEIWQIIEQK